MQQTTRPDTIVFAVEQSDVKAFEADVLALKYAQSFFGADRAVAWALGKEETIQKALPQLGTHMLLDTGGKIRAKRVLFLSVQPLYRFRYAEIRQFAADVLHILPTSGPPIQSLAMTIHGVGYGLDEAEAMRYQLHGLLDSLQANRYPPALERITFVELNHERAQLLRDVLKAELPDGVWAVPTMTNIIGPAEVSPPSREPVRKPLVLVVMPFSDETEDMYQLGIKEPANQAGCLCEIVDVTPTIFLFSVDLDLVSELDRREVSTKLHGQFQKNCITLTPQAQVEVKQAGSYWLVGDADTKYLILSENQTLNVHKKALRAETGLVAATSQNSTDYMARLHRLMVEHLNDEELRTLCFTLDVDYDSLGGEGKTGKMRELLWYLSRRTRLLELVEKAKQERPDVEWPDLASTPSAQLLLELFKPKLDMAAFLVADITIPNPNTFLMVGYAWGQGKPTLLLTRDPTTAPIRLDSRRYVVYRQIHKLKETLSKEFEGLANDPTAQKQQPSASS